MGAEFDKTVHAFEIAGTALEVSTIQRGGSRPPIVFLHGFGSTKEDYIDIICRPEFNDRPFLAYDAPGCGETNCADLSKLSIAFLVETALAMLDHKGIEKFHIVGHSMGGLTALMLANAHPERVLSFTDIEGNIAPEDCFLSRQIVEHANPDPKMFLNEFIQRTSQMPAYASALYAACLRHKVREGAVCPIFTSMVELSDHGNLMQKFLGLSCPKMFMYGDQNASLSYLDFIRSNGVLLSEIPDCGHFPMYSNPTVMWQDIATFINNEAG